jgi:hypothetical protein
VTSLVLFVNPRSMPMAPPGATGASTEQPGALAGRIAERVARLPGVQAVGYTDVTTLAAASVALVVTGLLATLVASARVFRANPADTLRAG